MADAVPTAHDRTDAHVDLRLLGPLRLEVEGTDRTPPGPLLRVLLALLGSARGAPVPEAELTEALVQVGGEAAGGAGRDVLPVHVSRLRDLLGPAAGALGSSAFGYQLRGPGLTVDVDRVEAATLAARTAAATGDGETAVHALRRALDAWAGPLAEDLPDVPALRAPRRAAATRREELVAELAEARMRVGSAAQCARAASELREHLDGDPRSARAWSLLVLALHRAGRPGEALACHRQALAALPAPDAGPPAPPADLLELPADPVLSLVERAAARAARDPERPTDAEGAALVWLDGSGRTRVCSLPRTGSIVVGRRPGVDVRLDDPSVSRAHAAVVRVAGLPALVDLGSRHGTLVNGRPVTDGTTLRTGDVVRCGTVVLLVSRPAGRLDLGDAQTLDAQTLDAQARRQLPAARDERREGVLAGG